jgi:hypothetical protein
MHRFDRWLYLLLAWLLFGCRDNRPATQQQQHAEIPAIQILDQDDSAMVAQFNADAAKVRMLMMLSPT